MKYFRIAALSGSLVAAVLYARDVSASRNSVGTMAAANGPYISGTSISSSAINARFSDIETEITDSLSRSGKGGMTAALKGTDGTVAAPAFSFTTEPGSGLYRIGANDFGFSVNGVKKHEWTSTGESVTGTLALSDLYTQTLAGSASTLAHTIFQPSLTNGNFVQMRLGRTTGNFDYGAIGFIPNATASLSAVCLGINGALAAAFCVDGTNKATAAGALAVTGAATLPTITGPTAQAGGWTVGGGSSVSKINYGSCVCNGSTPSSCTATATSTDKCVVSLAGGAAVASGYSISGTTLTVFCPNGNTSAATFFCFTP